MSEVASSKLLLEAAFISISFATAMGPPRDFLDHEEDVGPGQLVHIGAAY